MQIHFTKQFPWGSPSHFIEKIWAGFSRNDFLMFEHNGEWATELYKEQWPYGNLNDEVGSWWGPFMRSKPKIHTIRKDLHNRWKPRVKIHFVQWIGKPYSSKCYQFAPVIPCMSVQDLEIKYDKGLPIVLIDGCVFYNLSSGIDKGMEQLAINDGFNTVDEFFRWFCADFKGRVIQWTDIQYGK